MTRTTVIVSIVSLALGATGAHRRAHAQLTPNPNPVGNTITIGNNNYPDNNTVFTNHGTVTLSGFSGLRNYGTFNTDGQLNVAPSFATDDSFIENFSLLNNNPGGVITAGYGFLYNYATWNNSAGATMNAPQGLSNAGGTFTNAGTFNGFGGGSIGNGAGASVVNSGTMTLGGISGNNSGGIFTNSGSLSFTGPFQNFGQFTNAMSGSFGSNTFVENESGAVWQNFGFMNTRSYVTNDGGATMTNTGTMQPFIMELKPGGVLNNSGSLSIGVLIDNQGTVTNGNQGTINNNGTVTMSSMTNSGTMTGSGSNIGSLIDMGTLTPGNPTANTAGVYSVTGDYTKSGGVLNVGLGGLSNGGGNNSLTQFDWLKIGGGASFTVPTTIDVSLLAGLSASSLTPGEKFAIVKAGGMISGFQYLSLDTSAAQLPGGYGWKLTQAGSEIDLNVVAPEPDGLTMSAIAILALVAVAARRAFSTKRLAGNAANRRRFIGHLAHAAVSVGEK